MAIEIFSESVQSGPACGMMFWQRTNTDTHKHRHTHAQRAPSAPSAPSAAPLPPLCRPSAAPLPPLCRPCLPRTRLTWSSKLRPKGMEEMAFHTFQLDGDARETNDDGTEVIRSRSLDGSLLPP